MSGSERQVAQGFDAAVEGAWRDFREVLADTMETLRDGRIPLFIKQRDDAVRRHFVAVRRAGDEVVVWVASNSTVAPEQRLSRSSLTDLRRLGLSRHSANGYTAAFPMSHVDEAAVLVVSVMRDVLGVVHPSMLVSRDRGLTPEPPAGSSSTWGDDVIRPLSPTHLGHIVTGTVTAMLGHEPHRDSDGDIVVTKGQAVAFVRCHPRRTLVQVFGHLAVDIDPEGGPPADAEVARLNAEHELLKFVHADGAVFVSVDLPAAPFVPAHLKGALAHLLHVIDVEQESVAAATGGRTFLGAPQAVPSDGEPDRIHPVMARFLQLDALGEGSVDAHAMAKLCGHDDDLILELIRWNQEQEIEWMESRDEALDRGEQPEADACEQERAHAERTVTLLRQTLHLVLLGESA